MGPARDDLICLQVLLLELNYSTLKQVISFPSHSCNLGSPNYGQDPKDIKRYITWVSSCGLNLTALLYCSLGLGHLVLLAWLLA